MKKRKGISLIVLVITIIVIIILSTAVIVSVVTNNPVEEANQARYESDVDSMQAVFTNTVAKIMAKNQGTVNVVSGKINRISSGVKQTTGEVSYTVTNAANSENSSGTIYFAKGENTDTEYFTGKELPIYAAGQTKWYVDIEGNISVEISGKKYGNGETIVLEGAGQTYHTMAPSTLSFRSTADLDEFKEVQINGETLDIANYTLTEGSTIVTLSAEYLKTLEAGKYEITVVSESRAASVEFEVVAPELNEYGFYYNQPYTGYVDYFGENETFFIREDGTMDIIGTPSGDISPATYTCEGATLTVISTIAGQLTGTISNNGTSIYCNELGVEFKLGNENIVSDEEYIYMYDTSLGGYMVSPIDKTQASYGAIKTGINGKSTVKIADYAFEGNENLIIAPIIPDTVTEIGELAFSDCSSLISVTIPNSVTTVKMYAFEYCENLTTIIFEGTVDKWNAITKDRDWNYMVPAIEVKCSDGTVEI